MKTIVLTRARAGALMLLLLFTAAWIPATVSAQSYASQQTVDQNGTLSAVVPFTTFAPTGTDVQNPSQAVTAPLSDFATLRVSGISVLGGTVGLFGWSEITLSNFGTTIPGGKTTYIRADLPELTAISLDLTKLVNILNLLTNQGVRVTSNGGPTTAKFVKGTDGSLYIAATPTNNYTSVTVRLDLAKLSNVVTGVASMKVYYAVYEDNADCGQPKYIDLGESAGVTNLTVGNLFSNQERAIDGNMGTYSLIGGTGISVDAIGSLSQSVVFGGTMPASENVAMFISVPNALVDLTLFNSITVETLNGSTVVDPPVTLSSLVNLNLLMLNIGIGNEIPANTIIPYYLKPTGSFDRIRITVSGTLSATILGGGVRIYEVYTTPAKPTLAQNFKTIYKNQSIGTVTATSATGTSVQWYESSGTAIGTAGTGSANFPAPPTVTFPNAGTFTFYANASRAGCPARSDSTRLTVRVLDLSLLTPGTGEIGIAYSPGGVLASSPSRTLSFALASGQLPDGLTLGSNGVVSGNPEPDAINKSFDVTITDVTGPGSIPAGTYTFTIKIKLEFSDGTFPTTFNNLHTYSATWNTGGVARGGSGTYAYGIASQPGARVAGLPPGFTFSGNTLSGNPFGITPETYDIPIQVTDNATPQASAPGTFSFEIDLGLPVELVNFEVKREQMIGQLSWSSSEEVNTDRFEIERSINGKIWSRIGIRPASGNSRTQRDYFFSDENPASGINYYRLKMVDKDGSFTRSEIESLSFGNIESMSLSPNPAFNKIKLKIAGTNDIKKVEVFSLAGQTMYQASNPDNFEINISKLPVGIYLMSVTKPDGSVTTQRFIKQ